MAWEDIRLNAHLRDWDVSEARDRAIEERAAELLERRGPKGYHPLGGNVDIAFDEKYTAGEVLGAIRPHLEAGDHCAAGEAIAKWLLRIAKAEAAVEAAIQIDAERNEPTSAQMDAYDDRESGR